MNVYCVNGWYLLKSITYPLNECVLCKWMVYELKCCCCCCYSITQLCSVCWDPMDCSMSGFPVLHHLPELAKTHIHRSVITSNDLILCRPRLLLPSIFPSIRVFSNESVLHIRRPKYWSFSFSTSLSNAYSVLISFRMDCLDLLAVQGTLKILLQHHSSKASILRCSAFSIVQLSHWYMTTGKSTALNRWIFVGKVIPLLFNMLSMSVIIFLPRSIFWFHGSSHHLQWFWSPPK